MTAAAGDGPGLFVDVVAFSDTARAGLLALDAGDSLAVAGTLKPGAYIDREGNAKPSVNLVAAQVLTTYGLKKKREAAAEAQATPPALRRAADDGFGHDEAWLRGGA